ncbi:hypothetical protein NL676_035111 [Syzygium grande]|nr:hypothetical protein NL676_035111 [Syzygium grande]
MATTTTREQPDCLRATLGGKLSRSLSIEPVGFSRAAPKGNGTARRRHGSGSNAMGTRDSHRAVYLSGQMVVGDAVHRCGLAQQQLVGLRGEVVACDAAAQCNRETQMVARARTTIARPKGWR